MLNHGRVNKAGKSRVIVHCIINLQYEDGENIALLLISHLARDQGCIWEGGVNAGRHRMPAYMLLFLCKSATVATDPITHELADTSAYHYVSRELSLLSKRRA